jgi:hypothetical protein
MKAKTIDEYTGRPPGSFAKFVLEQEEAERAEQRALVRRILESQKKNKK